MIYECSIGGEMEIDGISDKRDGDSDCIPELGFSHHILCDTGRSALKLVLTDWIARGGSGKVWLPEYICTSVVRVVHQLGLELQIYGDQPALTHLDRPPNPRAGDAVLFVHYFGKINQPFLHWLNKKSRDWTLIEDCVQALYTNGVGVVGDYAITSLRKWWSVVDGAVVWSRQELILNSPLSLPNETFLGMRLWAKWLRHNVAADLESLDLIEKSETLLENSVPRACSWMSKRILSGCIAGSTISPRRENWAVLQQSLSSYFFSSFGFLPLQEKLDDGEVPLIFVLRCGKNRDLLREHLRMHRIYCPVHWQLDDQSSISDSARQLSAEILGIPIDHRYGTKHMLRVCNEIQAFVKGQIV